MREIREKRTLIGSATKASCTLEDGVAFRECTTDGVYEYIEDKPRVVCNVTRFGLISLMPSRMSISPASANTCKWH